jgi:hypothetical protein
MKDIAAPPKFFRPAAVENNFSQKSRSVELNNGIGSTFDMKSEILSNILKHVGNSL